MTAPAIDAIMIEHLDRQPLCDAPDHKGHLPAEFWRNAHDCHRNLVCVRCVAFYADQLQELLERFGYAGCRVCLRTFPSAEAFVTVVPL